MSGRGPHSRLDRRQGRPRDYCGCCGLLEVGPCAVFCRQCRPHIKPGCSFEQATYFAQHGDFCPVIVAAATESARRMLRGLLVLSRLQSAGRRARRSI